MAIIRACTYSCGITLPDDPDEYSRILVTFAQNGNKLIDLTEEDVGTEDGAIQVTLTQEQTKLFTAPGKAVMQVRAYKSATDAPGSKLFAIEVWPALNDEVLS